MEEKTDETLLGKKKWCKPELLTINIKNTASGDNPSDSEDTPQLQATLS